MTCFLPPFNQQVDESLEHYIRQAQKLTGVCEDREDMHEDLTVRYCRGLWGKGHQNWLATMEDMWSKPGQVCFKTCIANACRIARSDISYRESLFLTDSDSDSDSESSADSSSDSDFSKDDQRSRRKKKCKERKRRRDQRQRNRKENPRTLGKDSTGGIANLLEEKVKELAKKMEEIQGQTSQAKVALVSPVNINRPTVMPRYMPPLGYGATELQVHPSNLIEAEWPDWMASNPSIVCDNCKNLGHFESRCL